jgi:hypothetical protein
MDLVGGTGTGLPGTGTGLGSGGALCDSELEGGLQLEGETNDMTLLTVTRLQC